MKLYLCEKPSQARDIAKVISASVSKDGYLTTPDNSTLVTWAIGHLLQQYNPEDYSEDFKKWDMETLPIIPTQWRMKPSENAKKQYKIVSGLIKKAEEIVIATDADREGEVIGVELLEINDFKGVRSRLWLSALDEKSIQKALDDVRSADDTYPLYEAGLGRQRADWLYGLSVTRGLTIANKGRVDGVLNAGRVQTPTLKLVVDRDNEIENFKPTDYFDIETVFDAQSGTYKGKFQPTDDMLVDDYLIDKSIAQNVVDIIKKRPDGVIKEYKKETKTKSAPMGYSLSQLQKECSSLFGFSATETLKTAQSLYETHKATTYPRSDCRYLPTEQESEIDSVIEMIFENNSSDKKITNVRSKIDLDKRTKIWNTKKVTAHHAIIPTAAKFNLSALNEQELSLYLLVRNNYLMQFLDEYVYESVLISTKVDKYFFESRGNTPQNIGWKELITNSSSETKPNEPKLPPVAEGEVVAVMESDITPKQTKPKSRFTEGTLIDAMKNIAKYVTDPELKKVLRENSGIGTEATRANIIEKLFATVYLEKEGKKKIKSTIKGRSMISIAPALLKSPETTSLWEQILEDVSNSTKTLSEFMDLQEKELVKIIDEIKSGKSTLTTTISGHECKKCGMGLIKRKSQRGFFWGCSGYPECTQAYPDNKGKPDFDAKPKEAPKDTGHKCPLCESSVTENEKVFRCSKSGTWDPKAKKFSGCQFGIIKHIRPLDYTLSKGDLATLLAKVPVEVNGKKLVFDTSSQFFVKVELPKVDIQCPLCSADVNDTGKGYRCSKAGSWDSSKKSFSGCGFNVMKHIKPIKWDMDLETLTKMISGEVIDVDGKKVSFDKENPFFIKLDFGSGGSSSVSMDVKCPSCNGKMLDTPKVFRCVNTGRWDPKKKKMDGKCNVSIFKGNRKLGRDLTAEELAVLMSGGSVSEGKNSIKLDLDSKYLLV